MAERGANLTTLQAGRAAAAIMVVIFHVNGFYLAADYAYGESPVQFFGWFFAGVEFFFVLSGFIIAHAHWGELREGGLLGAGARLRRYAYKRFTRIYPVYWLVIVPVLAVYAAAPQFGPENARDPLAILAALALAPTPEFPILVVAWTLHHELLFYCAFALLLASPRLGAVALGAWLLGCVAMLPFEPPFPVSFLLSPHNLLFFMGMAVQRLVVAGVFRERAWLLCALGAGLFVTIGVQDTYAAQPLPEALRTLGFGAGAALLIHGLASAEQAGRLSAPPWLRFLGDASYSIYLAHIPVVAAATYLLGRAGLTELVPITLALVAVTAVGVVSGVALYGFGERPMLAYFRRRGPRRPRLVGALPGGGVD